MCDRPLTHWPPIEKLVPHQKPMLLLDEVVDWDRRVMTAAVTISRGRLFCEPAGVPGYVGIEYMAQSCGAFVGMQAFESGQPVRIGFVLGTRRYLTNRSWFRFGERLLVSSTLVYHENAMGMFDTKIMVRDQLAAEAQLTVYQPSAEALDTLIRETRDDSRSKPWRHPI